MLGGRGDWSEKGIWQMLKQTLFVCTSVALAGIIFSCDLTHRTILCYVSFHTFPSSLQMFNKKRRDTLQMTDEGRGSRQSASRRPNESVEALYQDASPLWH